jgi:ketosteroid isomerase-like protein
MSGSDRDVKLATIKALYDGVAGGDRAAIEAVLAPDCITIEADSLPYGGVTKGHDGFNGLMAAIFSTFSDFAMSDVEYIIDGDAAFAIFQLRATIASTGKVIDQPVAELWRFRDDKLALLQPFYFDTHAVFEAARETALSD